MAGPSPDRSGETPFSELEKGFFAAAPPEVPHPSPEPMRFDDLVPIEAPRPQDVASFRREIPTGMRRAVDAASATRTALKRVLGGAGERVRPAIASVKGRATTIASTAARGTKVALAATARGSKIAFAAARIGSVRVARAGAGRFVAVLSTRRSFAVALAIAVVVTGISLGVVASRSPASASAPVAAAPAIAAPPAAEPSPPIAPASPTVVAQAAPVAIAPLPPALEPRPSSSAEPRPPRAAAPKRPARPHRRPATYSARNDLIVPSFMTASPRQEAGNRPAPAPANRPLFSR